MCLRRAPATLPIATTAAVPTALPTTIPATAPTPAPTLITTAQPVAGTTEAPTLASLPTVVPELRREIETAYNYYRVNNVLIGVPLD